jgi:hypothetical protein
LCNAGDNPVCNKNIIKQITSKAKEFKTDAIEHLKPELILPYIVYGLKNEVINTEIIDCKQTIGQRIDRITSNRATNKKELAVNVAFNTVLKPTQCVFDELKSLAEESVNEPKSQKLFTLATLAVVDGGFSLSAYCITSITIHSASALTKSMTQSTHSTVKGIKNIHTDMTQSKDIHNAKQMIENAKNKDGIYNHNAKGFSKSVDIIVIHVNTKIDSAVEKIKKYDKKIDNMQQPKSYSVSHNFKKNLYMNTQYSNFKKIARISKPFMGLLTDLEEQCIIHKNPDGLYINLL